MSHLPDLVGVIRRSTRSQPTPFQHPDPSVEWKPLDFLSLAAATYSARRLCIDYYAGSVTASQLKERIYRVCFLTAAHAYRRQGRQRSTRRRDPLRVGVVIVILNGNRETSVNHTVLLLDLHLAHILLQCSISQIFVYPVGAISCFPAAYMCVSVG